MTSHEAITIIPPDSEPAVELELDLTEEDRITQTYYREDETLPPQTTTVGPYEVRRFYTKWYVVDVRFAKVVSAQKDSFLEAITLAGILHSATIVEQLRVINGAPTQYDQNLL